MEAQQALENILIALCVVSEGTVVASGSSLMTNVLIVLAVDTERLQG
jgi:hypothetical protein